MDETSKSKKIWGPLEWSVLSGNGIDIGCGSDPVLPQVKKFDVVDGDANHIRNFVTGQFDFVFSSHCLEHMNDPKSALLEWWKLVKAGGYIFCIVPDEDLYEQGVFPSRFNPDHKATFTISKSKSWSPVSINVIDLVKSLPNAEVVNVNLQDHFYDRTKLKFGQLSRPPFAIKLLIYLYRGFKKTIVRKIVSLENLMSMYTLYDQTATGPALAQISFIARKAA